MFDRKALQKIAAGTSLAFGMLTTPVYATEAKEPAPIVMHVQNQDTTNYVLNPQASKVDEKKDETKKDEKKEEPSINKNNNGLLYVILGIGLIYALTRGGGGDGGVPIEKPPGPHPEFREGGRGFSGYKGLPEYAMPQRMPGSAREVPDQRYMINIFHKDF